MIDKECICCKRHYSQSCEGVEDRKRKVITSSNACSGFLHVCNENDCNCDEELFWEIKEQEIEIGIN